MGFTYYRTVTVLHGQVPSGQSNFPVCIGGTYSWLKNVANGGHVQEIHGFDIVFATDTAGVTRLNFERNIYDPTTGQVEFWVQFPSVSSAADTAIYIVYGDVSVTTDQSNKNATWDSNFVTVWHTNTVDHLLRDSTVTGNDTGGSGSGGITNVAGTGTLQRSLNYDGTQNANYGPSTSAFPTGSAERTVESWFNVTGLTSEGTIAGYGKTFAFPGTHYSEFDLVCVPGSPGQLGIDTYFGGWQFPFTLDNNWHHLAAVYPPGQTLLNQTLLYLDGVLKTPSESGPSIPSSLATQTGNASAGIYSDHATGVVLVGYTAETRFSKIARSQNWVKTHYNNVTLGDFQSPFFYQIGPENTSVSVRPYIFVVT